jgi:GAF domain-containing protein
VTAADRHLRLLTETTAAVNSTLDLEEVLHLVADKVADALRADACFVYLYDERTDELVLRATHGTSVDELTRRPRMRPGEGITGSAAAASSPPTRSRRSTARAASSACGSTARTSEASSRTGSTQTHHPQPAFERVVLVLALVPGA